MTLPERVDDAIELFRRNTLLGLSHAYSGSRLMRRKAKSADETKYWRDVAMAVAQIARKRIGLDTETRMAAVADFGDGREPGTWEHERRKVNPIDELKRLVGEQGAEPTPRWPRPASPGLQHHRRPRSFRLTGQRDFRALRRRGILGQATGSTDEHSQPR